MPSWTEGRKYVHDRALALIRRRSNEHVRERLNDARTTSPGCAAALSRAPEWPFLTALDHAASPRRRERYALTMDGDAAPDDVEPTSSAARRRSSTAWSETPLDQRLKLIGARPVTAMEQCGLGEAPSHHVAPCVPRKTMTMITRCTQCTESRPQRAQLPIRRNLRNEKGQESP